MTRAPWLSPLLLMAACGCGPYQDISTSDGASSSSNAAASSISSVSASTTGGPASTSSSGASVTGPEATCGFICDEDLPQETLCDLFAQSCPDGQKCAPYDTDADGVWDTTECVDAGDGQLGEPCTAEGDGIDDCGLGLICWTALEQGEGLCHALCSGTPARPSCPPDTICGICGSGCPAICRPTCDPLAQDCDAGYLCLSISSPGSDGLFACALDGSEGTAPEGTPCEFAYACNPGLMCVAPDFYPSQACQGSLGCCAPFCDLDYGDADCEGLLVEGLACVPFHEPGDAPEGLEDVGVCGVSP